MIEVPPTLRILSKGSRNRPTRGQIDAFQGAQTGHVCDAMNGQGALDMAIKPLPGTPHAICGPVLTADCGPGDILALVAALSEVEEGDVLLAATGGWQGCAAYGDMVSAMAKNAGAAGMVADGPARDLAGIQALDFPAFATGLNPNSPYDTGPGAVGYPVQIGGRQVASGDMIIGDQDGVVVVPFAQIDEVIAGLEVVRAAERDLEAKVKAGLAVPDAIADLFQGDAVTRT